MANKYRAEIPFEVDDQTYTLRLSNNDLVALEGKDELGVGVIRFLSHLAENQISVRDVLLILRRGLQTGSKMNVQQAARILDDVSMVDMSPVAIQLLSAACGLKTDEESKAEKKAPVNDPLSQSN